MFTSKNKNKSYLKIKVPTLDKEINDLMKYRLDMLNNLNK